MAKQIPLCVSALLLLLPLFVVGCSSETKVAPAAEQSKYAAPRESMERAYRSGGAARANPPGPR